MDETDYDRIYRRMHPPLFPYSPYERQRELRDLWPVEREKFRRMVDAVRADQKESGDGS